MINLSLLFKIIFSLKANKYDEEELRQFTSAKIATLIINNIDSSSTKNKIEMRLRTNLQKN